MISLSLLVVVPLLMLPLTREKVQRGVAVATAVKSKGEVTYGTR